MLKSTVQGTIIKRNGSTFPTSTDYFNILQYCARAHRPGNPCMHVTDLRAQGIH